MRLISMYCGRFVSWYSSTMTKRNCSEYFWRTTADVSNISTVFSRRSSKSSALASFSAAMYFAYTLAMFSSRRFQPDAADIWSGVSIRFFAWLMRESAARGWTKLSSIWSAFSACLTTDIWSAES